jgi:hypothetical protein
VPDRSSFQALKSLPVFPKSLHSLSNHLLWVVLVSSFLYLAASTKERLSQLINVASGQGTFVFEDKIKEQRLAAFLLICPLFVVENHDVEYYGSKKRATPVNRSNWYIVNLAPVSSFN